MDKFEKIFEFCDKEDKGHVNCLDFGKALEKLMTTSPKATPNPIREIFSLIDIKQKGFFTLEDYHRFLEQVLESEQDNYESVARIAYRYFVVDAVCSRWPTSMTANKSSTGDSTLRKPSLTQEGNQRVSDF